MTKYSKTGKNVFCLVVILLLLKVVALPTTAEPFDRRVGDPPIAVLERDDIVQRTKGTRPNSEETADEPRATQLTAAAGEASWKVDIDFRDGQIFNPGTGQFDKVRLRSYQGAGTDPDVPFVGPTVNLVPGDTFRITLNNKLTADDPSCGGHDDPNVPHCFNSTNLHAHGLWVSPSGNSDNVFVRINPGVSFTYEYHISADHPAGTFWYHPHLHGSTALQVSSGMAGVLIVQGTRLPSSSAPGDVDTLLRDADGSAFPQRILLFQQIQYACRDEAGEIKTEPSGDPHGRWACDAGDVGTIEGYDQFGPGSWTDSGRYTTINGRVMPTFESVAGQIERWRMIHAGVHETIKPSFKKLSAPSDEMASAKAYTAVTEFAQAAFVDANCSGATVSQLSLATDGFTRDQLSPQTEGVLQPGYREDLLMVFPEPGIYCIVDGEAKVEETVNQRSKGRELLGFVKVGPGSRAGGPDTTGYVKQRLIASAQAFMPEEIKARIVADLEQRLGLTAFTPHKSIAESEVMGYQTLGFRIVTAPDPDTGRLERRFEVGEIGRESGPEEKRTLLNSRPYDPARIDRLLTLGSVDEWTLASFFGGHPFHIHINPFQIVSVTDQEGNDVSGSEPGNTSQYAGLKGVWKDTIFLNGNGYTVVMRTRYRRYIGDFVLHCHILDHEDQGMMQNVRISLPDGRGGITPTHH